MHAISHRQGRRLALARAGLLKPDWTGLPRRAAGRGRRAREAALAHVRRFGYLQLDTVAVAGARSHALVLLSRLEGGDADIPAIEQEGIDALRAAGFRPDYFEVRMAGTLARPHGQDVDVVVLTAARLGRARLIDNVQCRATGDLGDGQ